MVNDEQKKIRKPNKEKYRYSSTYHGVFGQVVALCSKIVLQIAPVGDFYKTSMLHCGCLKQQESIAENSYRSFLQYYHTALAANCLFTSIIYL